MNTAYNVKPNGMAQVVITGSHPDIDLTKEGLGLLPGIGYVHELNVPVLPKLIVERVHEGAVLPTYASEGDSGMDIYSPVNVLVRPQETVKIGVGFKMGIPRHPLHDLGYRWEVQSRPRSGLNLKTEIVVKLGTIDNFYTDEPGVIMKNDTQTAYEVRLDTEKEDGYVESIRAEYEVETNMCVCDLKGNKVKNDELVEIGLAEWYQDSLPKGTLLVRKGDRIAQFVFSQVIRPMEIVEGKVDDSVSRGGGFGSTGT